MKMDYEMPLEEAEAMYDAATIGAFERLNQLGLGMPARPKGEDSTYYDGYLPAGTNNFSNAELGEIYSLQCRFSDWIASEHIKAKAEAANAKKKLELTFAHVSKTKTGTVKAKEAATRRDARVVEADTHHLELKLFADFLEVRVESASHGLKFISRLITQKGQEIEANRRDLNIGRTRRPRRRDE